MFEPGMLRSGPGMTVFFSIKERQVHGSARQDHNMTQLSMRNLEVMP